MSLVLHKWKKFFDISISFIADYSEIPKLDNLKSVLDKRASFYNKAKTMTITETIDSDI